MSSSLLNIYIYTPKQCFKQFGEQVSNARRQGDLDSSQSILADTFKLLDNSAYGKSLTNIAKHRDIHYVTSEQTKKLVNESRFQKLTELSEDLAEAEMSKKKINWALPLQIGYFVYQYAKLRMLQFYWLSGQVCVTWRFSSAGNGHRLTLHGP